jgi:hypothetical protein
MTNKSYVFSLAAFILIICGFILGENKKKVPQSVSVTQQQAGPVTQKMIRDIAIDDIFVDANCRVWVRWINKGNVKIDKILREKVFADGNPLQSDNLNHVVLEAGAVFAHGVGADPGMKISGAATVHACIDADNVLTESNEDNNSKVKTLNCGKALPDLMPTYISCHTLHSYVDAQNHNCKVFEVSVTIKNFGAKGITTPFKVFVERDSGANLSYIPFATYDVPGLAAGDSLTLEPKHQTDSCFWYLHNPTLTYVSPRIRVTVDSGNSVVESLENNNQTVHSCNL